MTSEHGRYHTGVTFLSFRLASTVQSSAVAKDYTCLSTSSHALSGVRDSKHVPLCVSCQLISSDADGAIQRAGRFRVENGSSDEVQAAKTGGAQPCLQEMIFICNHSTYIVFT